MRIVQAERNNFEFDIVLELLERQERFALAD